MQIFFEIHVVVCLVCGAKKTQNRPNLEVFWLWLS